MAISGRAGVREQISAPYHRIGYVFLGGGRCRLVATELMSGMRLLQKLLSCVISDFSSGDIPGVFLLPHRMPRQCSTTVQSVQKRPRKHGFLTDSLRRVICEYKRDNPSVGQVNIVNWLVATHGLTITQATVSNTLRRSEVILRDVRTANSSTKLHRKVTYPLVEQALLVWIRAHEGLVSMSGEVLMEKAKQYFQELYPNMQPLVFGSGWLQGFRSRNKIWMRQRSGESGSAVVAGVECSLPEIRQVLDGYGLCDVYSMAETGLFYRLQADRTMATQQMAGGEGNQERITIALCTNADGTDKLPLLVIGNATNPRCFRDVDRDSIGCMYLANQKAWVTQGVFKKWLLEFDRRMDGRHVVLLLDNCRAHIQPGNLANHGIALRNTRLLFLPPPTTTKIHPCDAGITRTFKLCFRKRFNILVLGQLETGARAPEKINLLEGINMAVATWKNDVQPSTIESCFRGCELRSEPVGGDDTHAQVSDAVERELAALVERFEFKNPMTVEELVSNEIENADIVAPISDDAILEEFRNNGVPHIEARENEESGNGEEVPPHSFAAANEMLASLQKYCLTMPGDEMDYLYVLQGMRHKLAMIHSRGVQETS